MARRFTILHTNDLHSALLGVGPSSEYTPDTLGDDVTVGGFARLATLIAERRTACQERGPVLVLDGGDYSMGTAFGAADPETGGDLRLLELMGYDATTLGNHEFDLGPDGLARSIETAASVSGRSVAIVASNLDVESDDPRTSELRRVVDAGSVRRSLVIERDGMRFGVLGVMGEQARSCILDVATVRFADPVATAAAVAAELRAEEQVDVVICLSHGGLLPDADGAFTIGPDVDVAEAVPDIDVVIGGHSHHGVSPPIVAPSGTPVVQAGKFGEVLGELELTRHDDGTWSATNTLHVVDDTIPGDPVVAAEVDRLATLSSELLFAVDGLRMDQPLAIASADLSNSFTDLEASGPLADLVTDAFRDATGADVALTVNGLIRAPIRRGAQGVQTVYDIFGLTPIGEGVGDTAIGTHLVIATMTPRRLAWLVELLLADSPRRPGRHVPRTSGLRYRFDATAVPLARVVSMESGDAERGYRALALDDDRQLTVAMPANLGSISTRAHGELTLELGDIMVTATQPVPPVREWEAVVRRLQRMATERGGVLPVIPPADATAERRVIEVSART